MRAPGLPRRRSTCLARRRASPHPRALSAPPRPPSTTVSRAPCRPPPAAGVKGTLAYFPERKDAVGSVTVDKAVGGNDLTLKATYQLRGDVFTLQARAPRRAAALGGRPRAPAGGESLRSGPAVGAGAASRAPAIRLVTVAPRAPTPAPAALKPQETWKFDKQNKVVGT